MNQLDLKGRVAVVTGGRIGIGAAIAQRMEASGARVRIWDIGDRDAPVDVTDQAAIERATERTIAELGRIDILVNNAGIAGMTRPVVDYPVDEWKRVIDIDLNGPFLCCRAVVPHMVKAGYGRIVNIASVAGKEGNPNAAAYAAAKGGVIAFTKSLAREVAAAGVRVNCVCPGPTDTPLLGQVAAYSQKLYDGLARGIPMRRIGQPADIAPAVVFLASDGAGYVTGQTLSVSGGLTMA